MTAVSNKKRKAKAGHQEIQGETIAKFELFDNGWNPYSRYLDEDKVDIILRKRKRPEIIYKEIQVKYGRLYSLKTGKFDMSSWKTGILENEFKDRKNDSNFFIVYIVAHPKEGYKGDIFIFPIKDYMYLISQAISTKRKEKPAKTLKMVRFRADRSKWYILTDSFAKNKKLNNCIEITKHRRDFHRLN